MTERAPQVDLVEEEVLRVLHRKARKTPFKLVDKAGNVVGEVDPIVRSIEILTKAGFLTEHEAGRRQKFCVGWDGRCTSDNGNPAKPPRFAFRKQTVARRGGAPWMCRPCFDRKTVQQAESRRLQLQECCPGVDGNSCNSDHGTPAKPTQDALSPRCVKRRNGRPWLCGPCSRKNPEVGKRLSENLKWRARVAEANRRKARDPEVRRKQVIAQQALGQSQERRTKMKAIAARNSKDPEWIRKNAEHLARLNAKRAKKP